MRRCMLRNCKKRLVRIWNRLLDNFISWVENYSLKNVSCLDKTFQLQPIHDGKYFKFIKINIRTLSYDIFRNSPSCLFIFACHSTHINIHLLRFNTNFELKKAYQTNFRCLLPFFCIIILYTYDEAREAIRYTYYYNFSLYSLLGTCVNII